MARLYTKRGDKGWTELADGTSVAKTDLRVQAYGTVDELSSFIGLAAAESCPKRVLSTLYWIQERLFVVGVILAHPKMSVPQGISQLTISDVKVLEDEIDRFESSLPALTSFIVPGGTKGAALLHCARSICRRAEREICRLEPLKSGQGEVILQFLNRLSDYLFAAARLINHLDGLGDRLVKA